MQLMRCMQGDSPFRPSCARVSRSTVVGQLIFSRSPAGDVKQLPRDDALTAVRNGLWIIVAHGKSFRRERNRPEIRHPVGGSDREAVALPSRVVAIHFDTG